MTTILLIRHGETEWNRELIFRGRADIPLSARGREQVRLLAYSLSGTSAAAVYSSPLLRASETAQPLAESLGLSPVIDDRLVDMSFGEWEGRAVAEVQDKWAELYQVWVNEPARFSAPGGESLAAVRQRAWAAVEDIVGRHLEATIALVSHRVICKLVLCAALGIGEEGFWRERVDTASVSTLELDHGQWVVTGMNQTHHLRALSGTDRADF